MTMFFNQRSNRLDTQPPESPMLRPPLIVINLDHQCFSRHRSHYFPRHHLLPERLNGTGIKRCLYMIWPISLKIDLGPYQTALNHSYRQDLPHSHRQGLPYEDSHGLLSVCHHYACHRSAFLTVNFQATLE